MKNMIIENKQLRKAMDKNGLSHFSLAKNKDYFWIVANKNATEEEEYAALWAPSIGVYAFNRQSVDSWIKDIKNSLKEAFENHGEWFERGKHPEWFEGSCHMSIEDYDAEVKSRK